MEQYNKLFDDEGTRSLFGEDSEDRPLPYIVIIIDELADLMMLDSGNVEESVTRLAQNGASRGHSPGAGRRSGQSVDVITGLIKANFPARISFPRGHQGGLAHHSRCQRRRSPAGTWRHALPALRFQLAFIGCMRPSLRKKKIAAVVEFWKSQGLAEYEEKFLHAPKDEHAPGEPRPAGEEGAEENDPTLQRRSTPGHRVRQSVTSPGCKRRLRIGYGRAAHLI